MKNDEAVSTVIAMMLILGIIATLIAIYSATYLPGLKQQSEIEHSREVANAFVRFGSDIDYVISQKKPARFSEPFSLGGGDVLLSPVRSSGLVTIEERPLVNVTVTNQTGEMTLNASLVNVSYVPSFTTWEPQGYRWEYGFVAVTKDDVAVPLSSRYNTRNEALNKTIQQFVGMKRTNADLEITLVNLTAKEHDWFMTGSGIATLGLNATVPDPEIIKEVTKIVFEDSVTPSLGPSITGMKDHLGTLCNATVENHPDDNYGLPVDGSSPQTHTLTFDPPVTVTLRTVNVEVSVC